MAKLIDYKKINDYSKKTFILDTNVWLYIQSDIHKSDFGYSKIFETLLENEATILLPPLVSTEFINRYCRLKHQIIIDKIIEENKSKKGKYRKPLPSYKADFRPSAQYAFCFNYIISLMKEDIQPISKFVAIEEDDINKAFKYPCLGDLNDDIILNIAERTNSILVTHDRDFLKSQKNIELIQL